MAYKYLNDHDRLPTNHPGAHTDEQIGDSPYTTGVELFAVAWIVGTFAFFRWTSERTRENVLVVAWAILLLPVLYAFLRLLI